MYLQPGHKLVWFFYDWCPANNLAAKTMPKIYMMKTRKPPCLLAIFVEEYLIDFHVTRVAMADCYSKETMGEYLDQCKVEGRPMTADIRLICPNNGINRGN